MVSVPQSCDGQRLRAGPQAVSDEYVPCIHWLFVCRSINQPSVKSATGDASLLSPVLIHEPDNPEASEFLPLIKKKLLEGESLLHTNTNTLQSPKHIMEMRCVFSPQSKRHSRATGRRMRKKIAKMMMTITSLEAMRSPLRAQAAPLRPAPLPRHQTMTVKKKKGKWTDTSRVLPLTFAPDGNPCSSGAGVGGSVALLSCDWKLCCRFRSSLSAWLFICSYFTCRLNSCRGYILRLITWSLCGHSVIPPVQFALNKLL